MRLSRVYDDDGEPLGYGLVSGVALLNNTDQRAAFERLPPVFRFKEAKLTYGKASQPTTDFLQNCVAAGILRKTAKRYEKIAQQTKDQITGSGGPAPEPELNQEISALLDNGPCRTVEEGSQSASV
jgi:hypothetical protein